MTQRELKNLLVEASRPDCSEQRRQDITSEIHHAAIPPNKQSPTILDNYKGVMISYLFSDMAFERPHLLPTLFPVFSFIIFSSSLPDHKERIDWSLVDDNEEEEESTPPSTRDQIIRAIQRALEGSGKIKITFKPDAVRKLAQLLNMNNAIVGLTLIDKINITTVLETSNWGEVNRSFIVQLIDMQAEVNQHWFAMRMSGALEAIEVVE
jgi:hypothetical protein